jgi:transcriptional regulator with GAF, ATPase, and Fis domain
VSFERGGDGKTRKVDARIVSATNKKSAEGNMPAALMRCGWKICGDHGAARLLGRKPTTLIERMRALRIKRLR